MKCLSGRLVRILVSRVALFYLIALAFFLWGVATISFDIFPNSKIQPLLKSIKAWVSGVPEGDKVSLKDKIKADFFAADTRLIGQTNIANQFEIKLEKVLDPHKLLHDSTQELKFNSNANEGYYAIYTVINKPDAKFGVVILSSKGELVQVISRPIIHDSNFKNLGQGGITDFGYFIFNSYRNLYVANSCGVPVLEIKEDDGLGFHHKSSGDQNSIWTWNKNEARNYDFTTGKLTIRFSLLDLISANPEIAIFEPRLIKANKAGHIGQWKYSDLQSGIKLEQISLADPFHQNDIDVLTTKMAEKFPQFEVGDLLLSFRSINLIVIVDPKNLHVKWHVFGQFSRQHDPDWGNNGEIIVYDNRSHTKYSKIVSINIETLEPTTLVDGSDIGFYQFAGGNQHLDQFGRVMFTNGAEAVQFSKNGLVFYFSNIDSSGDSLDVGEVRYINQKTYNSWFKKCR